MLFDKTPGEVLSEDAEAKARRVREEAEARARWEQELEGGRRRREEQREVARRFKEAVQDHTPAGRAKAAMDVGATVFQLVLPMAVRRAAAGEAAADHNPTLNAIEAIGWRMAQASYVEASRAAGQPDGDPTGTDELFAVYVFRRSI